MGCSLYEKTSIKRKLHDTLKKLKQNTMYDKGIKAVSILKYKFHNSNMNLTGGMMFFPFFRGLKILAPSLFLLIGIVVF